MPDILSVFAHFLDLQFVLFVFIGSRRIIRRGHSRPIGIDGHRAAGIHHLHTWETSSALGTIMESTWWGVLGP